MKEITNR